MKIRTDFVTNSSSSSFTLMINFELENSDDVTFVGHGATPESGTIDYFDYEALVTVSPKELGTTETIDDMIKLLVDGVRDDDWEDRPKIFVPENENGSYYFVNEIKEKIASMGDIKSITIRGDEENFVNYLRSYTYDRETGSYTGMQYGSDIEKDGSPGGTLEFDLSGCEVKYVDDEEEFDSIGLASGDIDDYQEDDVEVEEDEYEAEGEPEPEGDRFEAYYKKGNGNEIKFFDLEYKNPVIKTILHKYNYCSEMLDDDPTTTISCLEDVIPN